MRFLLYNIRYGAGIGRRFHFPLPYSGYLKSTQANIGRITRFIQSQEPDVIGLVEVDSGSFRTRRNHQARAIAEAVDHTSVYRCKYGRGSMAHKLPLLNKQGNAFLTNRRVVDTRFHYLNNGIKRLVIELELQDVTLFLVHLALTYRNRQYQLQDLYSILKASRKPVIVAGDFNAFWGDREMNLFMAATGLENANVDRQPSHPSRAPRRELDFILHDPRIRVAGFQAPQVRFSDHVPLICDFDLAA